MIHEEFLKERLEFLYDQIQLAIVNSGRSNSEVKLIAISKYHTIETIMDVFSHGQKIFGENYVQEAIYKQSKLSGLPIEWHFTGKLQTNKAKDIAGQFAYIHTIDSIKLAKVLSCRLPENGPNQKILIQVNIGDEPQKAGITAAELPFLAEAILSLPKLNLCGLMCLPPVTRRKEVSCHYFSRLRELRDNLEVLLGVFLPELSMGMSDDYIQAIKEGATLVRIGTNIFGHRVKNR